MHGRLILTLLPTCITPDQQNPGQSRRFTTEEIVLNCEALGLVIAAVTEREIVAWGEFADGRGFELRRQCEAQGLPIVNTAMLSAPLPFDWRDYRRKEQADPPPSFPRGARITFR